MMKRISRLIVLIILICGYSCNQFTYLPKSAKQKYFARPHVQFMMAVVNFRELRGVWPPSLSELGLYSIENRKIIDDFQYQTVDFVIKNNDKLTVYFDNYKKQLYLHDDERIDLNRNYINQLIRSSSSVAANYRSVRRAKSKPDFINKLKIVEEELDESLLFLELLHEFNQSKRDKIINIHSDGDELLKIIVATINSSRN